MGDPFGDLEESGPRTDPEAVEAAHRQAEVLMMDDMARHRSAGYKLMARQATAIAIWKRPDGQYVAQFPGVAEVEL